MSDSIEVHRVRKFASGITHLAQQKHTRLRDKVRVETDVNAKISLFDQVAATGMQKKSARDADTPIIPILHNRRAVITNTYDTGDTVDKSDLLRVLNDPKSAYSVSMAMATGRQYDDIIIASADTDARTGEDGDQTTVHPTSHKETTAGNISLIKMLATKRILDGAEVMEEDRYAIISSLQEEALLQIDQVISSDYNVIRALAKGEINEYLNFTWDRSERLLYNAGSTVLRRALFYQKESILLAVASDVESHVDQRVDKSYSWQIYYAFDAGATRMDETGVVAMVCDET